MINKQRSRAKGHAVSLLLFFSQCRVAIAKQTPVKCVCSDSCECVCVCVIHNIQSVSQSVRQSL